MRDGIPAAPALSLPAGSQPAIMLVVCVVPVFWVMQHGLTASEPLTGERRTPGVHGGG